MSRQFAASLVKLAVAAPHAPELRAAEQQTLAFLLSA
jgi:hypothetical protein